MKVYLDAGGKAAGDLFWDDGESIGLHCYIFVYLCYGLRHSHYHEKVIKKTSYRKLIEYLPIGQILG